MNATPTLGDYGNVIGSLAASSVPGQRVSAVSQIAAHTCWGQFFCENFKTKTKKHFLVIGLSLLFHPLLAPLWSWWGTQWLNYCVWQHKGEQINQIAFFVANFCLPLSATAFEEEANMRFEVSPCKQLFSQENAMQAIKKHKVRYCGKIAWMPPLQ